MTSCCSSTHGNSSALSSLVEQHHLTTQPPSNNAIVRRPAIRPSDRRPALYPFKNMTFRTSVCTIALWYSNLLLLAVLVVPVQAAYFAAPSPVLHHSDTIGDRQASLTHIQPASRQQNFPANEEAILRARLGDTTGTMQQSSATSPAAATPVAHSIESKHRQAFSNGGNLAPRSGGFPPFSGGFPLLPYTSGTYNVHFGDGYPPQFLAAGPFGGPVNGPFGSPYGGPIGGSIGGPIGVPYGGPISGPLSPIIGNPLLFAGGGPAIGGVPPPGLVPPPPILGGVSGNIVPGAYGPPIPLDGGAYAGGGGPGNFNYKYKYDYPDPYFQYGYPGVVGHDPYNNYGGMLRILGRILQELTHELLLFCKIITNLPTAQCWFEAD